MPNRATELVWDEKSASPEGGLNRAAIVRAAIAIADAKGLDAVSIRHVAAALDVRPMSLYTHVASKDDLLDLMVNEVDRATRSSPSRCRPAGARRCARSRVQLLPRVLAHPWALEAFGAAPPRRPQRAAPRRPVGGRRGAARPCARRRVARAGDPGRVHVRARGARVDVRRGDGAPPLPGDRPRAVPAPRPDGHSRAGPTARRRSRRGSRSCSRASRGATRAGERRAAALVRARGARPAVAADARPVGDPRLRGHAAADPGGAGRAVLRALPGPVPGPGGVRGGAGVVDPAGLERAGLQPARAGAAPGGAAWWRGRGGRTTSPRCRAWARTRRRRWRRSRSGRRCWRSTSTCDGSCRGAGWRSRSRRRSSTRR